MFKVGDRVIEIPEPNWTGELKELRLDGHGNPWWLVKWDKEWDADNWVAEFELAPSDSGATTNE